MMRWRDTIVGLVTSQVDTSDELTHWREPILRATIIAVVAAGLVSFFLVFPTALLQKLWLQAALYIIDLVVLALFVILQRRWSYTQRASGVMVILYYTSVIAFATNGLLGNGRTLFIAFSIITSLLLGLRPGMVAIFFSVLLMAGFGVGVGLGYLSYFDAIANQTHMILKDWILAGAFFIVGTGLVIAAQNTLLNRIRTSLTEQRMLSADLEKERNSLEYRVSSRTQDLEKRLAQIRTASEISRSLSTQLDPSALLNQVVEELQKSFNLYYVGVFLLDDNGEYAVLRAGSGEAGRRMITDGHKLKASGSSMIGWTVTNRKARIALDVGTEAVRFNNPHLPLTRSEMALPIISHDEVLGAMTVQSTLQNAFDESDILILQSIADSLATAFENARLFESTQATLEEIRILNRVYLQRAWEEVQEAHGEMEFTYQSDLGSEGVPTPVKVPLVLRDQSIGSLTIEIENETPTAEEMDFLNSIASQTALALESARLLEQTQRRVAQEERLNQISAQFSRATTVEDILKTAVSELGKLPAVTEVRIALVPPGSSSLASGGNGNGHQE